MDIGRGTTFPAAMAEGKNVKAHERENFKSDVGRFRTSEAESL